MNTETTSQDIRRKTKLSGKVLKTTLAGAIVDIGLDKPGVVHISQMSEKPVKRVEDVVEVGQEVEVWVRKVNKDANHIELSMIEPLALEWREIKKGMTVTGQVVKLEKFGAFIEIGAERPGLAHISELAHEYLKRPEDLLKVGQEVQVMVLDLDRKKKQIKLSMKALQEPPAPEVYEEEEEVDNTPALTAMEIAYRKALGGADDKAGQSEKQSVQGKGSSTQDDIIARTLEQKARSK